MEMNENQKKAVFSSSKNTLVSAGAGSGKTAVLSERVLEFVKGNIIFDGEDELDAKKRNKLDNLLILTFTNLAAAEMKERIRKKLIKNNLDEAKNVDTADICTFDSFASSLVKKYHFKLGLSSNMKNVNSTIILVYKRTKLEEILEEYYQRKDPKFIKLVDELCFKDDDNLKKLILKIHDEAEKSVYKDEFLKNFVNKYYSKNMCDLYVRKVEDILIPLRDKYVDMLEYLPNIPLNTKTDVTIAEKAISNAEDFKKASNYNDLMESFNRAKLPSWPSRCEEDSTYFKEVKQYREKIKKKWFSGEYPTSQSLFDEIMTNKEYAEVIIEIVIKLDKEQWNYKLSKQIFEFNDIAKFALNLVKNNPSIREELSKKYRMIMVDEYQDTSALQEEFLSLLDTNKYMVGDIKQSIYAFRNAESKIFKDKYDLFQRNPKEGQLIEMNENYRSREEVLDDINVIFSEIMTDKIGGANYRKNHVIKFGNKSYNQAKNSKTNYHSTFIKYNKLYNTEIVDSEIQIIAQDIINKINNRFQIFVPGDEDKNIPPKLRNVQFSDFCIIIDRGSSFQQYKKIFDKYRIPLYIEANDNIRDDSLVKVIKSLLVIISSILKDDYDSVDFKVAHYSVLRSFIYSKSDKEIYLLNKEEDYSNSELVRTIRNIIEENKDVSSYYLVEKVIDNLDILGKLTLIGNVKKYERYLDKFMQYFKEMSDIDYSIEDFIDFLDNVDEYNLKIELPSAGVDLNSVKIMNIHKSKGLEYPIIYYPGLYKEFNRMENKDNFNFNKLFGLVLPLPNKFEGGLLKKVCNYYDCLDDLSEKIRLLYVSLTRTREKMIFIVPEKINLLPFEESKSFFNILFPLQKNFKIITNEDIPSEVLGDTDPYEEQLDIKVEKVEFDLTKKQKHNASKELKLDTNKEALKFGTSLHEILEVIDFVNPDYSIVKNDYQKRIIQRFINSNILKDIKNAKIFKEYEFISSSIQGIIDLLLIYDDHIDIIDYKTKNIDDEAYVLQLKAYEDFVKSKIDLPVNTYLYSLLEGTYKKTN